MRQELLLHVSPYLCSSDLLNVHENSQVPGLSSACCILLALLCPVVMLGLP